MQIDWYRNLSLIENRELWQCSIEQAQSDFIYASVCQRLVESRGAFSLFFPVDPFSGFTVDPCWDSDWRGALVCEYETPSLFGYRETYHRGNEGRPGTAILRAYLANSETREMLKKANSFCDWQAPMPENLAAYDWRGNLVCFSIGHEEQVWFRRGLLFEDFVPSRNAR